MAGARLVLADDDFLVRQGAAALLGVVDEIDLVDTVGDPDALLKAVATHRPDAVLTVPSKAVVLNRANRSMCRGQAHVGVRPAPPVAGSFRITAIGVVYDTPQYR